MSNTSDLVKLDKSRGRLAIVPEIPLRVLAVVIAMACPLIAQAAEKKDSGTGSTEQATGVTTTTTTTTSIPKSSGGGPSESTFCPSGSIESVPFYYLGSSQTTDSVRAILQQVKLPAGNSTTKEEPCGRIIGTNIGSPRSIDIYGNETGREMLKRFIGSLDLPLERVKMDLWAIQISSASPAQLSEVMSQVQRVVDQTREAMQETYQKLSEDSYSRLRFGENDPDVLALKKYGFADAIAINNQPPLLSLTQLLLRLQFNENPLQNYNKAAQEICNFFAGNKDPKFELFNQFEGRELERFNIQRIFNDDPPRAYRRPFQGLMEAALKQKFDPRNRQPYCGEGALLAPQKSDGKSQQFQGTTSATSNRAQINTGQEFRWNRETEALRRRQNAIINFAENYWRFKSDPSNYNPIELAKNAAIVDGMTNRIVEAIDRDIEAYFIRPTLLKIRQIVGRNRGVEYAEVGRTTVAGINGQTATLTSGTESSFDDPTPLRLGPWLNSSAAYLGKDGSVPTVLPNLKDVTLGSFAPSAATSNLPLVSSLLGQLPAQNAVALLAALSEEKVRWQSLSSGLRLKLTPVVMRDQTQAEVDVNLVIADPALLDSSIDSKDPTSFNNVQFKGSEQGLRPLSRISKSILDTKVYVNTMDLFALSSFNNQTTITGRRWYVPLIGTIWQGAFGDIPVVGGWFSFKRPPQNMQHQSIVLTNTLIVPSAMGMASYFNNQNNPADYYNPLNPYPSRYPNSQRTSPWGLSLIHI